MSLVPHDGCVIWYVKGCCLCCCHSRVGYAFNNVFRCIIHKFSLKHLRNLMKEEAEELVPLALVRLTQAFKSIKVEQHNKVKFPGCLSVWASLYLSPSSPNLKNTALTSLQLGFQLHLSMY